MARRRSSSLGPLIIGGIVVLAVLILVLKWLLITAAILIVPFSVWFVHDRFHSPVARRRSEVLSRATVDAFGGCGWCGSRMRHQDSSTGRVMSPAEFHRAEIDRAAARVR